MIAGLMFGLVRPSAAAEPDAIEKSLTPWKPNGTGLVSGALTIIMHQARVTDTIYSAVITSGLCMSQLAYPTIIAGVTEIRVLNRFGAQGYVLEGGRALCDKLNKMPLGSTAWIGVLYGNTHAY